jgi:hypothetical protein
MSSIPQHEPVPFWHRLRQITLYPVRGAALAMLVGLTAGSLLGYLPVLGFVFSIIVWGSAYKFAFEILRTTADGHMDAPDAMTSVDGGVVWRFIGLQFVMALVFLAALAGGGPVIGIVVLVLIVLMQPGCIMSLAIDGDFGRAIDPTTTFAIMSRVGAPYFAVFALLLVIQASAATAGEWLSTLMPAVLGELALTLFSFWGLFAAFHLMGYLVYQYHDELGYEPERHRNALPQLGNRDGDLMQQAETLVRDGRPEAAIELLRAEIRSRSVGLDTHELYRRLLRNGNDPGAADEHARVYLNLLMMEKQERRALGLLREALDANPDFVPLQLEHAEQLAERARMSGQSQLAVDAWLAMLRRHPKEDGAVRWALAAALLMVDRLGRDAEARELLLRARAQGGDAEMIGKIDAALKPLQNLPA